MYFLRLQKVPKTPVTRKNQSFAPFVRECKHITQPSQPCHCNHTCLGQGAAKLAPHGYMKKIYTRALLKQSSHNGLSKAVIYVVILSVTVFLWNYLCERLTFNDERGALNDELNKENDGERTPSVVNYLVIS